MSVIRVAKDKHFTVMSNYHLRDKRLSLKAMGLMSYMLSCRDDWSYTVEGLTSCTKDGRDSVRAALKELETAGYLTKVRVHGENGKFAGWDYELHESPPGEFAQPNTDFPNSVEPKSVLPNSENPTLRNTNTKEILKERNTAQCAEEQAKREARFNRFWAAWPKKKDKLRARQMFDKLNPTDAEVDLWIQRAQVQAADLLRKHHGDKDCMQFMPNPDKWLRGHNWEDECGGQPPPPKVKRMEDETW